MSPALFTAIDAKKVGDLGSKIRVKAWKQAIDEAKIDHFVGLDLVMSRTPGGNALARRIDEIAGELWERLTPTEKEAPPKKKASKTKGGR